MPWIAVLLAVIVIGAFVWITVAGKNRTKAMRGVAERLGYEYHESLSGLTEVLGQFDQLSSGGSYAHRASNLLTGKTDGVALTLFDDTWTSGTRKNRRTHYQSVLLLASQQLKLPGFVLRPEGFYAKLETAMGGQDIDFDDHPAFSKAYILKGDDEAQLRALFNRQRLDFFAAHRGLSVEGRGEGLLIYRAEKRVAPKEVESFVAEGLEIVRLFES